MTADELACKLDRIQLVVDMIVDRLAKVEQRLDGVSPTVALQERIERLARRQRRLACTAETMWSSIVSALRDVSVAVEELGDAAESATSDLDSYDLTKEDDEC